MQIAKINDFLATGKCTYLFRKNNLIHSRLYLKARSHDPFLRIRFLVLKTGNRRSDGPISRFHFYGENVGRSFQN